MNPILFVEDDLDYSKTLTKVLEEDGFEIVAVHDTSSAISLLSQRKFSLVISDLYIDNLDGVQLAGVAKSIQPQVNFIILTGLPTVQNEYRALSENVDLFLEKKKSARIISEYIKKLSTTRIVDAPFEAKNIIVTKRENIIMDLSNNEVKKNDTLVGLTQTEFTILRILLENRNQLVTRAQIIETIWGDEKINERTIDVHIKNIREKLKTFSIVSVHGKGYRWSE